MRKLGVFESMRVVDGRVWFLHRHLGRFARGAEAVELKGFEPGPVEGAIGSLLARVDLPSCACLRLEGTGLPVTTLRWDVREIAVRSAPLDLFVSSHRVEPDPWRAHKTTARELMDAARDEARAAGFDEGLLVRPDGRLVEGAITNVFVVRDGEIVTPSLGQGCLSGIVREVLLEADRRGGPRVVEGEPTLSDLERADEVILTNALRGVLGVPRLGGAGLERSLPGDGGEFAQRLRAHWVERGEAEAVAPAGPGPGGSAILGAPGQDRAGGEDPPRP